MSEKMVLAESEAVELLAFLITAARCLLEEPADYGAMRLLDAAERLCLFGQGKASPEAQELFAHIIDRSPEIQGFINQRERYANELDSLCHSVAQFLVTSSNLEKVA